MSRTRKDQPAWLALNRAKNFTAEHHSLWQHRQGECDIDEPNRGGGRNTRCHRIPAWDAGTVTQAWFHHRCRTGKERRRLELWKPERRTTRDVLRHTRGTWNTTGSIDEDNLVIRQARRGPYAGGYWD